MAWETRRRAPFRNVLKGAAAFVAIIANACSGPSWSSEPPLEPQVDPGTKSIHRLNGAEYNFTVADTLLTKLEPATASWREGELGGFDNNASVLSVDEEQYGRYFAAAKALSADVMDDDARRARFVKCELDAAGCFQTCLRAAGRRVFRRPLTTGELEIYSQVYAGALALGDTTSAAFELVLRALLSSAPFLYRFEHDDSAAPGQAHELEPFELASRLSYFLWSSAPDEALLQAAADGTLSQAATLVASVDRMLSASQASRFVERFAGQWLGARSVVSHAVSSSFSDWSPVMARDAGAEMTLYFQEFLARDRSWLEFLKTDVHYLTEPLAHLYGMETPSEPRARVENQAGARAGFFGLAGFLAVSSFDRRTSPSLRGRWISSNLLCAEPPAPPPTVPTLTPAGSETEPTNIRQSLEQHRRSPGCASCHALFDPYGLALEEYDAIGQHRTAYADGSPIDATASLLPSAQYPEGVTFAGLRGLSDVVTADPRFAECVARKLLTYGLGRLVTAEDEPVLLGVIERWRAPGTVPTLRRLLYEVVLSDAFRRRRSERTP